MEQGDFPEKQDTGKFLIFVLGGFGEHCLYKLDLNRHFTPTNLPPQVPDFSLYRCSSSSSTRRRRRRPLSSPSVYRLTVGRCNRFLSISDTKKRKSLPPLLPEPYLKLFRATQLHMDMAMVAMGSHIFMFGGHHYGKAIKRSTDVFAIDIHNLDSNCGPVIVKKAVHMNSGKREPIACAIGGKIYVMPDPRFPGEKNIFECFDPGSNSCTILPSPPSTCTDLPKLDESEILIDRSWDMKEPLTVSSHAVVGSNLIISLGRPCTAVYAFDTAQPDRGWRRIFLSLTPSLSLNFIPFRSQSSFPIRDHAIFSRHHHDQESKFLDEFLQNRFNIGNGDSFVCTFGDLGSEFVKISIAPLSGVNVSSRVQKFVERPSGSKVAPIGDGLVLLAECGSKRNAQGEGDSPIHYTFDIFRVEEDDECNYVASRISSAFFRAKTYWAPTDISHAFVCKDGIFTN